MARRDRKILLIELAVLLVLGAAIGLYLHRSDMSNVLYVLIDVLFAQGSAILMWGICRQLGNMHMFTSTTYGFHRFHDLVRGKLMKSEVMKEDYLTYRSKRPFHPDAKPLLIIGAVMTVLSFAVSFLAVIPR